MDLSDIPPIPGDFEGRIAPLGVFGNDKSRLVRVADGRTDQWSVTRRENSLICLHQSAPLPWFARLIRFPRLHAGAGGARSRAISDRMSANSCRDTATSAMWKVT